MAEKKTTNQNTTENKKNANPPTPSQAEGDERTVDHALKNKQSKSHK